MNLPQSPSQAMYDDKDRDLIRRQLLGYMEQHRIGTPTLQARIAGSSDRSLDEVNNKTLQRFLAGRHRTNDSFVWLCHKFTLGVDAADPAREFGDAACRFYQHNDDADAVRDAAGEYEIAACAEDRGSEPVAYSKLKLDPVADRPFLRALESVIDHRAGEQNVPDDSPLEFEGVAFARVKGLSIVLRDVLTRRQRWHLFYPVPGDGEYAGSVMTPSHQGTTVGHNDVNRIEVTRQEAQPS
jgi:hypothetical protein